MNPDFPLHIDGRGRTANAPLFHHICQLFRLYLFTDPGERVNRPTFGGGLRSFVHECNSPELAAAMTFQLRSGLRQYLGDVLEVHSLDVRSEDSKLLIDVNYRISGSIDLISETISREGVS